MLAYSELIRLLMFHSSFNICTTPFSSSHEDKKKLPRSRQADFLGFEGKPARRLRAYLSSKTACITQFLLFTGREEI